MRTRHLLGLIAAGPLLSGCEQIRWLGRGEPATISVTVTGETPEDVANALRALPLTLPPERRQDFHYALETLKLAVPDKVDPRTVDGVTPQLAAIARGRSAEGIIQTAELWRASVPVDPPGR